MEVYKQSTESGSIGIGLALNSDLDSTPTSGNDVITADLGVLSGDGGGDVVAVMTTVDPTGEQKNGVEEANTVTVASVGLGGESALAKKKRGRPRKYDQDGNLTAAYLNRPAVHAVAQPLFTPVSYGYSSSGGKRGRGNGQALASFGNLLASTAGADFIPHVFTVQIGEDVAAKIFTFVQKSPRGICVLSASGSVSSVMLHQPTSSGGLLTYEGLFEIINLSGSFMSDESSELKTRIGRLSVSLSSPDGRIIGGGVAGMLVAATPILIVLGSFLTTSGVKLKRKQAPQTEPRNPSPTIQSAPLTVAVAVPLSQAPLESAVAVQLPPPQLQVQQGHAEADQGLNYKGHHPNLNASAAAAYGWNAASGPGPGPNSDQMQSSDIEASVPVVENT